MKLKKWWQNNEEITSKCLLFMLFIFWTWNETSDVKQMIGLSISSFALRSLTDRFTKLLAYMNSAKRKTIKILTKGFIKLFLFLKYDPLRYNPWKTFTYSYSLMKRDKRNVLTFLYILVVMLYLQYTLEWNVARETVGRA